MHLDFLESAEFYNRRYHNFSSRVIFPMSLLVVFTFGFAMFAEKEISLSSKATVEPSRIIANPNINTTKSDIGKITRLEKL